MTQASFWPGTDRTCGRGSIDHLERYYTPDDLAAFCLSLLPWDGIDAVLELHAGGGAFIRAADALPYPPRVIAIDADPNCWAVRHSRAAVGNALTHGFVGRIDRVIGNPPFSNAEQHIDRALELAPEVAYLLPMSRLDSAQRSHWWQAAPLRHVWLIAERIWPGSRQCGFFWFDRGWTDYPTFSIVRTR